MNTLKRTIFELGLRTGNVFATYVVGAGLVVPPDKLIDFTAFEYGDSMRKPIPDLEVSDGGISATLSISGVSFKTFVPWELVVKIEQPHSFATLFQLDMGPLCSGRPASA